MISRIIYDFESILVIYDLTRDYLRLSLECDCIEKFKNIGVYDYDYGLILSYEGFLIYFRPMILIRLITRECQEVSKLDF